MQCYNNVMADYSAENVEDMNVVKEHCETSLNTSDVVCKHFSSGINYLFCNLYKH